MIGYSSVRLPYIKGSYQYCDNLVCDGDWILCSDEQIRSAIYTSLPGSRCAREKSHVNVSLARYNANNVPD